MRNLSLLIGLCFITNICWAKQHESYDGWLLIDGKKINFSVDFSIAKNNLISGTSLTAKGTKDETKCKVKGKFNKKDKSILFYETVVISSKAKYENLNFCLLVANLKRKETKKLISYKGKVVGYIRGKKTICAQGKIYIERKKIKKIIKPTPRPKPNPPIKTDTLLSHIAGKKIIDYKWKSGNAILEIKDNVKADGDRVSIYLDGKKILSNYELSVSKKLIPLSLKGKKHIIKVVALNEGKASPNTSLITITSGKQKRKVISHIKKGEKVYIRLNQ